MWVEWSFLWAIYFSFWSLIYPEWFKTEFFCLMAVYNHSKFLLHWNSWLCSCHIDITPFELSRMFCLPDPFSCPTPTRCLTAGRTRLFSAVHIRLTMLPIWCKGLASTSSDESKAVFLKRKVSVEQNAVCCQVVSPKILACCTSVSDTFLSFTRALLLRVKSLHHKFSVTNSEM